MYIFIYMQSWKQCALPVIYHYNGFGIVATHALGHMMHG